MQELTRTQAHENVLITKIVEIEIRFLRNHIFCMNFKINATCNLAQDLLVDLFYFNEFALFSFVPETEERKFFF